jgi:hypothetical protein
MDVGIHEGWGQVQAPGVYRLMSQEAVIYAYDAAIGYRNGSIRHKTTLEHIHQGAVLDIEVTDLLSRSRSKNP